MLTLSVAVWHDGRHGPELRRRLFRRYDCTGYRDGGNRQVRSHHGQTVLRHCRCCGYRRRYLGVHRHECVRNGCMINSSLARG